MKYIQTKRLEQNEKVGGEGYFVSQTESASGNVGKVNHKNCYYFSQLGGDCKTEQNKSRKNPSLSSNDFSTRITKSEFRRPLKFKQGILCLAKPFDPTLIGFLFDSIFSVLAKGKKVVALSTSTNGAKTQMLYGRQGFTTKVRRNFLELRQYLKCVSYR